MSPTADNTVIVITTPKPGSCSKCAAADHIAAELRNRGAEVFID